MTYLFLCISNKISYSDIFIFAFARYKKNSVTIWFSFMLLLIVTKRVNFAYILTKLWYLEQWKLHTFMIFKQYFIIYFLTENRSAFYVTRVHFFYLSRTVIWECIPILNRFFFFKNIFMIILVFIYIYIPNYVYLCETIEYHKRFCVIFKWPYNDYLYHSWIFVNTCKRFTFLKRRNVNLKRKNRENQQR